MCLLSVQFSSVAQSCLILCDPMVCSTPGLPVQHQLSQSLLKLMSIESVMASSHLILCHPLLLLPSIFPALGSFQMSQLFASGGQNIGSFGFIRSKEYSGLLFFRMDWLDLLAVQGTLKSLLQRPSSKASKTPRPIPWQLLVYFLY